MILIKSLMNYFPNLVIEKVSKSLLKDNDVKIFQVENKSVIAIYVKAADILDRLSI